MATRLMATSESFAVEQVDVLYVAQQINLDLQSMSRTYPRLLSIDHAMNLFNSFVSFMANNAVKVMGFSIYDPKQDNKVYHELKYAILYGGDVQTVAPQGGRGGTGGRSIESVWIPTTAEFISWVIWSDHMLTLPQEKQRLIVSGTGWNTPGINSFKGKYDGGHWYNTGNYYSGNIAAESKEYKP
ncbi:MAG: hypothetical protein QY328_17340 [Anaerolineales bacterium]|nr:MAG: hypothetical protein QY328_17340 [Anaerolineales bacterium]